MPTSQVKRRSTPSNRGQSPRSGGQLTSNRRSITSNRRFISSEVPYLFPDIAEVLSQARIPFPNLSQLGSVLLASDFQQRNRSSRSGTSRVPGRVTGARFYIVGSHGSCPPETSRNGAVRVEALAFLPTCKRGFMGRICTPPLLHMALEVGTRLGVYEVTALGVDVTSTPTAPGSG
jgi:hypothetical protein